MKRLAVAVNASATKSIIKFACKTSNITRSIARNSKMEARAGVGANELVAAVAKRRVHLMRCAAAELFARPPNFTIAASIFDYRISFLKQKRSKWIVGGFEGIVAEKSEERGGRGGGERPCD